MFGQIKKKQHYVWKRYLNEWSLEDNKIWMLRGGNIANTNLENVGQQRYFYELYDLGPSEVAFLEKWVNASNNETLRNLNQWWVDFYKRLSDAQKLLKSKSDPELDSMANFLKKNVEEEVQGKIENSGAHVLDKLCRGEVSFFKDEEDEVCLDFIYFICHQYFRTKKIKDKTCEFLSGLADRGLDLKAMMPVIRHISATNVGFSLYAEREDYSLFMLEAPEGCFFLTCDQPVINKDAFDDADGFSEISDVKELSFYYPVSPKRAVLLSKQEATEGVITESLVESYNKLVIAASHEFVFSINDSDLKAL